MIFDIFSIIVSLLLSLINTDISLSLQKRIANGYVNLMPENNKRKNNLYCTFSDRDAIQRVITTQKSA